jgi:hypothetical protein
MIGVYILDSQKKGVKKPQIFISLPRYETNSFDLSAWVLPFGQSTK